MVAQAMNDLSELLKRKGELDEAEDLQRRTLAMRRKLLPPDHPHVAMSLINLGALLLGRGDTEGAEPLLREFLAFPRERLPAKRVDIPGTTVMLIRAMTANALAERNAAKAGEAVGLAEACVKEREASLPAGDWRLANTRAQLGGALAARGSLSAQAPRD